MIFQEQDKSSDIEQQPPFGDRKYRKTLHRKRKKTFATLSIITPAESFLYAN